MAGIVPEINASTRVLAILGNIDADPVDGDGWMFSDFCLLNQLIRDQGCEQVWLHAADFDQAVAQFGPIAHGNPHRERKIVYNENLTLGHTLRISVDNLKSTFLDHLSRMAGESRPGDRLLLVLIGHGEDKPNFGLCIGEEEESNPDYELKYLLRRPEVDSILGSLHSLKLVLLWQLDLFKQQPFHHGSCSRRQGVRLFSPVCKQGNTRRLFQRSTMRHP
jgi:hypothetical protein